MSSDMPDGTVVLYCANCKKATVLGSGQWVGVGHGFRESLALLAGKTKEEKDERL